MSNYVILCNMEFNLERATEILSRTPAVLNTLLQGLHEDWTKHNEGPETWSPYDVVGHLIHGEKTDWMARLEIILSDAQDKTFTPFDRFAQFEESKGKTLKMLLDEFALLRAENLKKLASKGNSDMDFERKGMHPALGEVTLRNLLSTWVVHDLGHIAQISRVMAKQWKAETGPWLEYLPVLTR